MTDETGLIPTESDDVPAQNLSAETLMAAGDVLSSSLTFALRRDYLDGPIFDENYVQLLTDIFPQQQDIAFLEVEQVGKPLGDNTHEYFQAIQTTLAACHDPRYRLVFLISSDGLRNRIFIGISAQAEDSQPKIFAEQLGQFLSSNWPGTRVKNISDYKRIIDQIHVPMSSYRYARAFTGIPSTKSSDKMNAYPQNLDLFMRGMRGKPYIYMVIADPIVERSVNQIVNTCQTLSGQVHAFTRSTIQRSQGSGTTDSMTTTQGEAATNSSTTGTSDSKSDTKNKGVLGTSLEKSSGINKGIKAVGLAGLSGLLLASGGPFLLSGMLGMFGQLLPSTGLSNVVGTNISESESLSKSTSLSTGETRSSSDSLTFGQEYLNKNAEACNKLLEKTVDRFEIARAQGCWNVGVYLITNQREAATQAQAQFKALVSGEKSTAEPMRAHDLGKYWDGQIQSALDVFQPPQLRLFDPQNNEQVQHPLGEAFEGLTTPMNTEELSILANLPMREIPGIPMQPAADFSMNPPIPDITTPSLKLGHILEGGEAIGNFNYEIDTNSLTRHALITGITGSGKSNTCRCLIEELMQQGKNFLVIEPAKNEYVQLAMAYNQSGTFDRKIAVYVPGRTHIGDTALEQLRLNPFDIIRMPNAMVQVMPHLDRLKSIFNASFPMYEILPIILEEALVDLYSSQGWLEEVLPSLAVQCPTLDQMHNRLTGLIRSKGYEERITLNITAAMKTRISSLMRGWKGKLFDQPASTPWADLFDRPVVINLQQMGDDADKCFTMSLLLNFLYEYRQAQYELEGTPEANILRHLTIIEEAHRILRKAASTAGEASPQSKMGEMFSDILAEIRVYGQGLAIVDQVPAKLVSDAIKNTNLKIIHRLVAADDRDAMASAMALTDDQAKVIARLKVGQAIVSGIQDDMASWVKIRQSSIPHSN
ncbi:MAG: ATP-binding protein [Anaerolineaceae bacterium]|nr:ATP-binding protein [Anaerolineaceae bacterium]